MDIKNAKYAKKEIWFKDPTIQAQINLQFQDVDKILDHIETDLGRRYFVRLILLGGSVENYPAVWRSEQALVIHCRRHIENYWLRIQRTVPDIEEELQQSSSLEDEEDAAAAVAASDSSTTEVVNEASGAYASSELLSTSDPFRYQVGRSEPKLFLYIRPQDRNPFRKFMLLNHSVFCEGVVPYPEFAMAGCSCTPNSGGRHMGCERPKDCSCLSNMDENKRFYAYYGPGPRKGLLVSKQLTSSTAIFECNQFCNCGPTCKNRVVQHGRKVPLEIFPTEDRGWGLRCPIDIRKGQFVDTYKGEIVTEKEAEDRDEVRKIKDIYTFALDKFDRGEHDPLYVVDGEFAGGPTRFINHSCDPNLRIFAVSLNHYSPSLYELAFFAIKDIPINTELTFDYRNGEASSSIPTQGNSDIDGLRCLCKSSNCRGKLF